MPNTEKPRSGVARTIAAHLDVGTIVTAVVGFSISFLVNNAVDKLDKLTDGVADLNEKMASVLVRGEYQEKKDAVQDERIQRLEERLLLPVK